MVVVQRGAEIKISIKEDLEVEIRKSVESFVFWKKELEDTYRRFLFNPLEAQDANLLDMTRKIFDEYNLSVEDIKEFSDDDDSYYYEELRRRKG